MCILSSFHVGVNSKLILYNIVLQYQPVKISFPKPIQIHMLYMPILYI